MNLINVIIFLVGFTATYTIAYKYFMRTNNKKMELEKKEFLRKLYNLEDSHNG